MKTKIKTDSVRGSIVGYVDDNKNKPIYEMATKIIVKLIDWNKIIDNLKKIDKSLDNAEWDIENRSNEGIINVDGKTFLIDNECCGSESEVKNIVIENNVHSSEFVTISLWKKYPAKEDGSRSISIMPSYHITYDLSDIEKYVIGEKQLWEFMGDRYEYNPRISNNLYNILKMKANETKTYQKIKIK